MKYNEMTDNEIERAVAIALGSVVRKSGFGTNYYFHSDKCLDEELAPIGPVDEFNPCNSWADAGPIIESARITLHAPTIHDDCQEIWIAHLTEHDQFCSIHENPLRAAMVVFLMINEDKVKFK